jgi:DNA replication ATP-dependent helicase Dna2
MRLWNEKDPELSLRDFFMIHVGIVTPHNAQRIALGDALKQEFLGVLSHDVVIRSEEEQIIRGAIRTVDKYQGSDRSIIIASMGVSSPSRLQEEEDFLYQLNRFNVTISRPKYRLLFVCSETFLLHIPKKEENIAMVKGIRAIMNKICTQRTSFYEGKLECTLHYSEK